MYNSFYMNGYLWRIYFLPKDHEKLIDRTNRFCVATTDPILKCIFLSEILQGGFLVRVLLHELGHCIMFSYDLISDIHRMIRPEYWIDAEEWICNFLADYGLMAFHIAYQVLGDDAWLFSLYTLDTYFSSER